MKWQQRLINPVLDKEFRLRMRTIRSPIALLVYLLAIGLMAFGYIYVTMGGFGNGSPGFNPENSRVMFYFLSCAQLGLIAFMTPGLTAGIVSGEREKQTLNMLLTTQQSSTTIIVSKLVSSLSFMLLVIVATMPVYSIVFLFGGISPSQLIKVFLFYLFIMFVLGAFGIMFSTLFKKTVISIIVSYGFTLFIFAGTGMLYLFFMEVMQRAYRGTTPPSYSWAGYILGFNPAAALLSLFEPGISRSVFRVTGSNNAQPPVELWEVCVPVYAVLAVAAVWISIRYIRPRLKKRS